MKEKCFSRAGQMCDIMVDKPQDREQDLDMQETFQRADTSISFTTSPQYPWSMHSIILHEYQNMRLCKSFIQHCIYLEPMHSLLINFSHP